MPEIAAGCARPTGSVVGAESTEPRLVQCAAEKKEVSMTARVGQKAPDFRAGDVDPHATEEFSRASFPS
jgi:hypothetical protein